MNIYKFFLLSYFLIIMVNLKNSDNNNIRLFKNISVPNTLMHPDYYITTLHPSIYEIIDNCVVHRDGYFDHIITLQEKENRLDHDNPLNQMIREHKYFKNFFEKDTIKISTNKELNFVKKALTFYEGLENPKDPLKNPKDYKLSIDLSSLGTRYNYYQMSKNLENITSIISSYLKLNALSSLAIQFNCEYLPKDNREGISSKKTQYHESFFNNIKLIFNDIENSTTLKNIELKLDRDTSVLLGEDRFNVVLLKADHLASQGKIVNLSGYFKEDNTIEAPIIFDYKLYNDYNWLTHEYEIKYNQSTNENIKHQKKQFKSIIISLLSMGENFFDHEMHHIELFKYLWDL